MDDQPHCFDKTTGEIDLKEAQWGSMFAILTEGESIYKSFMSWPGRCVLMRGDIFHGVYPVKSVPRRTIIIDYIILT